MRYNREWMSCHFFAAVGIMMICFFISPQNVSANTDETAREEVVRDSILFQSEQQAELQAILYKILGAQDKAFSMSWVPFVKSKEIVTPPFIWADLDDDYRMAYGLDDAKAVVVVSPLLALMPKDSSIAAGDLVLSIEGSEVKSAAWLDKKLLEYKEQGWVSFRLKRKQQVMDVRLPLMTLPQQVHVVVDENFTELYSSVSMYGEIVLSKPLLYFAQSQDELAYLVAHELGHLKSKHYAVQAGGRQARRFTKQGLRAASFVTQLATGVYDPIQAKGGASTRVFIKPMELAADEYALELMHSAGYDPQAAVFFVERLLIEVSGKDFLSFRSMHPADEDRVLMLKKKAEELLLTAPVVSAVSAAPEVKVDDGVGLAPGAQIERDGFDIRAIGLTDSGKSLTFKRLTVKPEHSFSAETKEIHWFMTLKGMGSTKFMLKSPAFKARWYDANGKIVYEDDFKIGKAYSDIARTKLSLADLNGVQLAGRWRVVVTANDKLIDDRYFTIGK